MERIIENNIVLVDKTVEKLKDDFVREHPLSAGLADSYALGTLESLLAAAIDRLEEFIDAERSCNDRQMEMTAYLAEGFIRRREEFVLNEEEDVVVPL